MRSYKARQDKEWNNSGSKHECEKSLWKSKIGCGTGTGMMRRAVCRKNDDGNVREALREDGSVDWAWSWGVISKRMDCHERECTTRLHIISSNIDSQKMGLNEEDCYWWRWRAIGLYRENAITIESEARDPFGGDVYYVTMQITFFIPEFARKERNLHCDVVVHVTPKWVL